MTKAAAEKRFSRIMAAIPDDADIQVIHITDGSDYPRRDRMDVVDLKDGVAELAESMGAELKMLEIHGKTAAYITERGNVRITQILMKKWRDTK